MASLNYLKDIPKNVITVIGPESKTINEMNIILNRQNISKKALLSMKRRTMALNLYDPYTDVIESFKEHILRNGLFRLELPSDTHYSIIIHHPDLPNRCRYMMRLDDVKMWRLISLITKCKNVNTRMLIGEFYYDPEIKFFVSNETGDDIIKYKIKLGEYLAVKKTKLVEGNKYAIENKGYCKELIYLGIVSNIITPEYPYNTNSIQISISDYNQEYILWGLEGRLHRSNNNHYLFKDDYNHYYLLQTKKPIKGSLIEENVDSKVSNKEFSYICSLNNWIVGLNKDDNKDQLIKIVKDSIVKRVQSNGSVINFIPALHNKIQATSYTSSQFYDLLTTVYVCNGHFHGDLAMFSNLFSEDVLGLNEQEIKNLIHEIWMECFGIE